MDAGNFLAALVILLNVVTDCIGLGGAFARTLVEWRR